jgi:hypothetical protein
VDRTLEPDRSTLLLRLACEYLLGLLAERPGVTHLEHIIATARQRARGRPNRRLAPFMTEDCKARLDSLLAVDPTIGRSPWPGSSIPSRRPRRTRSTSLWRSSPSARAGGSTARTCRR